MRFKILITLGIVVLLSGCSQETVTMPPTPSATGVLTPYHTGTPTLPLPTSTIMAVIPETPAPTATPFLHTITNDDTMLGIAYKYGITLAELQAANPGVDAHFLSVGKQLIIPIKGEIPEILPTLTPVPLETGLPRCYRTGEGGAWCIVTVINNLDVDVENLSAWIGLFSKGINIANQTVDAPLHLIRKTSTIPLMAYFSPPLPDEIEAQARILSGIGLSEGNERYIDVQVEAEPVVISVDGKEANISGKVSMGSDSASQIWVLGIAFDRNGEVVGARKWVSQGETQFEMTLYSLGGPINKVELLTEARP